jgi:hypothetical protein
LAGRRVEAPTARDCCRSRPRRDLLEPVQGDLQRIAGRQKIVVKFAGDADHFASKASKIFKR